MAPAVIPRAGADKDAADKPVRTVEAVRRAGVRVIRVVAIGAHGRSSNDDRWDSNADLNLSMCGRHREQEKSECREKF